MQSKWTLSTDQQNKITVESKLNFIMWSQGRAYAGFDAAFELRTILVGDGAQVKISCYTHKGKKLTVGGGAVFRNRLKGKIVIPEKVRTGDYIYLEVKIPKLKLKSDSNLIPVCPPLAVASIGWSKEVIHRDEDVELSCVFTNGVEDGDEAMVHIKEFDTEGYHDPVVRIPVVIKNEKITLKWRFIYQEDTDDIPTEEELKKYGKHYNPPEYFFIVMVNNTPIGINQESGLLRFEDTVDIEVQQGRVPPEEVETFILTTPDGNETSVTPDDKGIIGASDIPPGPFTIRPESSADDPDTVFGGKTGTPARVRIPDVTPLVDGHMHIQSNNCCPLPLQWGIKASRVPLVHLRSTTDRRKLNDTMQGVAASLFVGRFGKVGRLSTDLIGKLYCHKLSDYDMSQELLWIVDSEEDPAEKQSRELLHQAGQKAKLGKLNTRSENEWKQKFIEKTSYYFNGTELKRFSLALMMDLSFSHFWGRFGLPVYLDTDDALYYVNDFAAITFSAEENDVNGISYRQSVFTPHSSLPNDFTINRSQREDCQRSGNGTIHLYPRHLQQEIPICGGMSFYHYQYSLLNNTRSAPSDRDIPLIRFTGGDGNMPLEELCAKKFVHIVDIARNEIVQSRNSDGMESNVKRFEDYTMQYKLTVASLLSFPLKLFAAYHYDPRRHQIHSAMQPEKLAEKILREHSFFTVDDTVQSPLIRLSNGVAYSNAPVFKAHPVFNNKEKMTAFIADHQRTTREALNEIFQFSDEGEGVFWAVKMYPRLGYSPDDFINYPNLDELYSNCALKRIPVITHCSQGGMSVHDYYLYERYDDNVIKDTYNISHAEKHFNGVVPGSNAKDSPVQWSNVLRKHTNLKVCLAHFGGYTTWEEIGEFNRIADQVRSREETTASGTYMHEDIYRDWIQTTAELITRYDNVYTDISCFDNNDPLISPETRKRDTRPKAYKLIAANLHYLITRYPDLIDRINVGSDWYMNEMNHDKGIGGYMLRMFNTLKLVTELLVKGKENGTSEVEPFDVWHQFTVVNPMRFMGLIDEKKGSKGPFEMKASLLEKYAERLKRLLEDPSWNREYNVAIDADTAVQKAITDIIEDFSKRVHSSYKLLKENQLIILAK